MNPYYLARFIYNTLLFCGWSRNLSHIREVTIYKPEDGSPMLVSVA